MQIILQSERDTEMMFFPVTYKAYRHICQRNLIVLVTWIILIDVIESSLEIEGMRKEAEVLGQTKRKSMKKARSSGIICSQVQSSVIRVHISECEADAAESVSAAMCMSGTARAHGLRVSVKRSESAKRYDNG